MDSAFDRVRMREWLRVHDLPFGVDAVQQSAMALSDAADALDWMTQFLAQSRLREEGDGLKMDMQDIPAEMKRRLLLHALEHLGQGDAPRGEAVSRAIAMLENGEKAMLGDWMIMPGECWHIAPAPPRRH